MGGRLSATKNVVKGQGKVPEASNGAFTAVEDAQNHHLFRSFLHRITRDASLKHLIRHPHHHRFDSAELVGLDGSFQRIRLAGRGGSGETWLCKNLLNNKLVAIKLQQRPIQSVLGTMAYNEITFQGLLSEGCIALVPAYEIMLTPSHLAQVMEFENGGNMAEYVAERVPNTPHTELILPEYEARYFFKQLVAGVSYMHSKNTAHRDIKLDNCLLCYSNEDNSTTNIPVSSATKETQEVRITSPLSSFSTKSADELPALKLADFQFVYTCTTSSSPKTPALLGTPVYMAPELLETRFKHHHHHLHHHHQQQQQEHHHNYEPMAADVWSSGIFLLASLIGAFPFDYEPGITDNEAAERDIFQEQEAMTWRESLFVKPYLRKFSPALKDLLDRMLEPDPMKRITMAGVKIHPWMSTPLQPEYEKKWRQLQQQQEMKTQQVEEMIKALDQNAVKERNEAVWQLVTEAEEEFQPKEHHHYHHHLFHHHHHHHHHRRTNSNRSTNSSERSDDEILKKKKKRFIDTESIPDGRRIDMRLRAVSREVED